MRKISPILSTIGIFMLSISASAAHADFDKSQHCPTLNQIHQRDTGVPALYGYNSEGKYFSSPGSVCSYCDKDVIFHATRFYPELTKYNQNEKILSCVYMTDLNVFMTLSNKGDY